MWDLVRVIGGIDSTGGGLVRHLLSTKSVLVLGCLLTTYCHRVFVLVLGYLLTICIVLKNVKFNYLAFFYM